MTDGRATDHTPGALEVLLAASQAAGEPLDGGIVIGLRVDELGDVDLDLSVAVANDVPAAPELLLRAIAQLLPDIAQTLGADAEAAGVTVIEQPRRVKGQG